MGDSIALWLEWEPLVWRYWVQTFDPASRKIPLAANNLILLGEYIQTVQTMQYRQINWKV